MTSAAPLQSQGRPVLGQICRYSLCIRESAFVTYVVTECPSSICICNKAPLRVHRSSDATGNHTSAAAASAVLHASEIETRNATASLQPQLSCVQHALEYAAGPTNLRINTKPLTVSAKAQGASALLHRLTAEQPAAASLSQQQEAWGSRNRMHCNDRGRCCSKRN